MPIYYDSKMIIPAPFVGINKTYQSREDGKHVGSLFNLVVRGKLAVNKGSPTSSGTFWTAGGYPPDETISSDSFLTSFKKKQEALRTLFATEGQSFEIVPLDGSASMRCNPRIRSIEFQEGPWVSTCDYTINLEADVLYIAGSTTEDTDFNSLKLARTSEDWNLEVADENQKTFRLTHGLSAQGKRFYLANGSLEREAWQQASGWVLTRLGLNEERMLASGILNLSLSGVWPYKAYNYMRNQRIDEGGGGFSVTETWLCAPSGIAATEEFTVNVRTGTQERITTVSIEGNIQGLEDNSGVFAPPNQTKYNNAVSKFSSVSSTLLTRAQNIAGVTLNSQPVSTVIGRNQTQGTISYNYEYNDRPSATIAGALTETIQITYRNPTDVFAVIPVLGRAAGPIFQNIGTITQREKRVSIEAVMPTGYGMPTTDALILTHRPNAGTFVFLSQDEESWSSTTGRYSRNTAWTWEL